MHHIKILAMKKSVTLSIFYILTSIAILVNIFVIIIFPNPFNIPSIVLLFLLIIIVLHTILNFHIIFYKDTNKKGKSIIVNEYKAYINELLEKNDYILKRYYTLDEIRLEYKKNTEILIKTQKCMLPKKLDVYKNISYSIFYNPSEIISGDFYDNIKIDNYKSMFIIADISGHGIAAAIVSAMLKSLFVAYAKTIHSPSELMNAINNSLIECMPNNYCLSAIIVLFDEQNKTITYTNASHPAFFIVRDNNLIELSISDTIVGLFPNTSYSERILNIKKNDILFFYTDGIIEASNSKKKNDLYGIERLKSAILQSANMSVNDMVTFIKYDFFRYIAFRAPDDDCTIVTIKIK